MNIDKGLKKLQDQFNENPLQTIVVGSLAVGAVSKLLTAVGNFYGRRIHDREIARRIRNQNVRRYR